MSNEIYEILKGKSISVLGDSISTFHGYSDNPKYNQTLKNHPPYYHNQMDVEDTYWMRLIEKYNLTLCVNNSWSGAYAVMRMPNVGYDGMGELSSGVARADKLTGKSGNKPDIIIVFMGMNDLGAQEDEATFAADYERIIKAIKLNYPDADVFCLSLADRDAYLKPRAESFNASIRASIANAGSRFTYVDLFNSKYSKEVYIENSIDGLHPDSKGMEYIFIELERAMNKYYLNKEITLNL